MRLLQDLLRPQDVEKYTVLVIDDSPVNLAVLRDLLAETYNVLVAADGAEGLLLAMDHQPHLILLDILMPGLSGYDVLRSLKSNGQTADIGVIFLTGLNNPEHEARGLKMGGVDFVVKPFNPEVLLARMAAHIRQLQLLNELEKLATIDSLTGIANRRQFDVTFLSEFNRAKRSNTTLSLGMIDIDYFKQYNDFYGHAAGDAALKAVAEVLDNGVKRGGDLAARYGGEEFTLIMPETDLSNAKLVAMTLCDSINNLKIDHVRSAAAPWLTVSIGLASTEADFGENTPAHLGMIELADSRLYRAKAAGRNQVNTE